MTPEEAVIQFIRGLYIRRQRTPRDPRGASLIRPRRVLVECNVSGLEALFRSVGYESEFDDYAE